MTAVAEKTWAPDISDQVRGLSSFDVLSNIESCYKHTFFIFDEDYEIDNIDEATLVVFSGALLDVDEFERVFKKVHDRFKNFVCLLPPDAHIGRVRQLAFDCGRHPFVYACFDQLVVSMLGDRNFTISLTLPVKNEGETIGIVIESFLTVCDNFVIGIDDKTTDNTREIINKYKTDRDKVFDFTWTGSFAKARNACMEKCDSDWIFMTEGHEWLSPSSIFKLEDLSWLPKEVTLINVKRRLKGFEQITSWPWLTRNHCGVHYKYDSHNAVFTDNTRENLSVNYFEVETIHHRSDDAFKRRRKQRKYLNKKNFLRCLSKDPKDTRALFYLATEYMDFDEYDKAIERFHEYLKLSSWHEERYEALIKLAACYERCNDIKSAIETYLKCFLEPVPRNDHMISLGEIFREENPERAIYYLTLAAHTPLYVGPIWMSKSNYEEKPWRLLCIIYSENGMLEKALECAETVKRNWPDTPEVDRIIEQIKSVLMLRS